MYCVIKCIVRGNQARVKNADLRHPSCTVIMQRRKSASPVHNVLTDLWCQARANRKNYIQATSFVKGGNGAFISDNKAAKHIVYCDKWGTRWRSWVRHCATSRKVAGSIPDGVTGIFH